MWTEENLKEVASSYINEQVEKNEFYEEELEYKDVLNAFLAGCKYIINNTQKETEK